MGKLSLQDIPRSRISIALIVLVALLAADVVYQGAMHVKWRRWMPTTPAVAKTTTQAAGSRPTTTQAATTPASKPAPPPEISAAIRKRSLFAPVVRRPTRPNLTGVLGRVAIFQTADGQTVGIAEGESNAGLKVKSIHDYEVVVEFEGKTETLKLFGEGGGPGGPPPAVAGPMPGPRRTR